MVLQKTEAALRDRRVAHSPRYSVHHRDLSRRTRPKRQASHPDPIRSDPIRSDPIRPDPTQPDPTRQGPTSESLSAHVTDGSVHFPRRDKSIFPKGNIMKTTFPRTARRGVLCPIRGFSYFEAHTESDEIAGGVSQPIPKSAAIGAPDPTRTDPNRPDPARTDPNRTDPNLPKPTRTDPNRFPDSSR